MRIQTEVDVDIDVELDEFTTKDILDELKDRINSNEITLKDLKKLFSLSLHGIEIETLDDEYKIDHIKKVWNKYTASQMEQLLKE